MIHHNPEGGGHGGEEIETLRYSKQQVGQTLGSVMFLQITARKTDILIRGLLPPLLMFLPQHVGVLILNVSDTPVIVVVVEDDHHEHQHEDNLVRQDVVADAGQLGDQCFLDKIRHRSKFQDLDDFHSSGSVTFSLNKAINSNTRQSGPVSLVQKY